MPNVVVSVVNDSTTRPVPEPSRTRTSTCFDPGLLGVNRKLGLADQSCASTQLDPS